MCIRDSREARLLIRDPKFKGYIHDVGGPTADFTGPACEKQIEKGVCSHRQCLFPEPCPNLRADHRKYVEILKDLRQDVYKRQGPDILAIHTTEEKLSVSSAGRVYAFLLRVLEKIR